MLVAFFKNRRFAAAVSRAARIGGFSALLAVVSFAPAQAPAARTFTLQHARAADVEPLIAQLLSGEPGARLQVDAAGNRLVLSGSASAERIVAEAVRALDKPPAVPAPAENVVRAYTYRGDEASLTALRAEMAPARLVLDPRTGQLIVHGSPAAHDEVARRLAGEAPRTPQPPASPPPGAEVSTIVALRGARPSAVVALAQQAMPNRIQVVPSGNPQLAATLQLDTPRGPVRIVPDEPGQRFLVSGPPLAVEQVARLLTVLGDPRGGGRARPLGRAPWGKVQEAVDAYRGVTPGAAPQIHSPQALAGRSLVRPVGYQAEAQPPPAETPPAAPEMAFEDPAQAERLRELGTRVDVEVLPDLDVILLRGNPRDVDEVLRIIEEIERISAQASPQIEVLPLAHANSGRVATTITANQLNLWGSLPGSARVTALNKPNALLVVGWGEAFKSVKELVAKLDQPVAADSQLRVFGLKHAPAAVLETTVREFFARREGMGAQVIVAADTRTNALVVHASPNDMQEVELMLARLDVNRGPDAQELRVFRLNNSLATDLAPVLQQALTGTERAPTTTTAAANQARAMVLKFLTIDAQGRRIIDSGLLQDVRITPDPRTNTLLVAAPGQAMELLAALITQLDSQPAALAQIKVFRIVNGDAADLVEMLRALLGTPQATVMGPQLAGAEGESALVALRFSVDSRTNSIIASGSGGDLAIVEAILLRLDESDVQQRKSSVFRLKNSPAAQVAQAINEFLRSERVVQQAAPGSVSAFRQIEGEVVVVPETISNSLILSATPRFYDEIRRLIEELDAQPPQVLIQVLIAEVLLNNTDEFGVELGLQDSLLFDRSLVGDVVETASGTLLGDTLNPGYNFNNVPLGNNGVPPAAVANSDKVGGQGLSNFSLGRVNNQLGFGGLVLSASSESVSVLIRALKVCGRLDVLSRPQVMTLDNQPAFIQVGQRVPQVVSTSLTTFGQVNSIELENIGLILGVRPRISPDGLVVMEVDAEKSRIDTSTPGIPIAIAANGQTITSPIYNTTLAQTSVSAASGQTIILGGLITKSNERFSRRVPYLSNIPLLGMLFRYDSKVGIRTELLIILTPHVVRTPEEADRLKQVEAGRMSWCLGDVQRLQGECGLCEPGQCHHCDEAAEVIYPDVDPHGIGLPAEGVMEVVPGPNAANPPEAVPTPAPLPEVGPALGPLQP